MVEKGELYLQLPSTTDLLSQCNKPADGGKENKWKWEEEEGDKCKLRSRRDRSSLNGTVIS